MDTKEDKDLPNNDIDNINVYLHGNNYINANNLNVEGPYKKCIMDNGADTSVIGKGWTIVAYTSRKANVVGFDKNAAVKRGLPIVSAITAVDLEDQTILIRIHEAVMNDASHHSLLSEFQVRECVYNLDSVWKKHGGSQTLSIKEDVIIPLQLKNCMMIFNHRNPSEEEIKTLTIHDITKDEVWNPKHYIEDPQDTFYDANSSDDDDEEDRTTQRISSLKKTDKEVFGHAVHLDIDKSKGIFIRDKELNTFLSQLPMKELINQDDIKANFFGQLPDVEEEPDIPPHLHRAVPQPIDYEQLAPHFAYQTAEIIRQTLKRTTQLAKTIIRQPLRRHFKSRFQMLRKKRLNEIISTDTYFSSIRSIEGYTCAQAFYGCTSRTIHVYGMRTESEFPEIYRDFIRERGAPHTLRRDNAQSEKSEAIMEINRENCIKDEFTEPHHPHQNPVEGGAIKYLKSKSKTLMDRTNTPPNLWFLCNKYIADVHNVTANPNNNWLVPNQVSGGIHQIFHTFYNSHGCNLSFT